MPYINWIRRKELRGKAIYLGLNADGVGELNYIITTILDASLQGGEEPCYADYNAALGVLEAVKLELYRRRIAPYEDEKMEENGDVFNFSPTN